MPVQRLARAMRLKAENIVENEDSAPKVEIINNNGIKKLTREK